MAPKFFYQGDNLRGDKISLGEVIEQDPLPSSLSTQLELELRHVVDVCNVLKAAETTRDFLRVTGGERSEGLLKRMRKLRLAPTADVTQHLNQVNRIDFILYVQVVSETNRQCIFTGGVADRST